MLMSNRTRVFGVLAALLCLFMALQLQADQDAPPLFLLNAGVGASALGMGGAVVGSSQGIESLVWNPAALAATPQGWLVELDGQQFGGSQSSNVGFSPDRGFRDYKYSQVYKLSGTQADFVSAGYAGSQMKHPFGFAIGWRRTEFLPPKFAPDQAAVGFATDFRFANGNPFEYFTGTISIEDSWEESGHPGEIMIGGGLKINSHLFLGGRYDHGIGEKVETYHLSSQVDLTSTSLNPPVEIHEHSNFSDEARTAVSENNFSVAVLAPVNSHLALGGTFEFGHSDGFLTKPSMWTFGAMITPTDTWSIGASLTYADYGGVGIPYIEGNTEYSTHFNQWRFGVEHRWSHVAARGGFVIDDQLYALSFEEDPNFYAFTAGLGYRFDIGHAQTSLNLAYWHETGSANTQDRRFGETISHASFRRLIFSISAKL